MALNQKKAVFLMIAGVLVLAIGTAGLLIKRDQDAVIDPVDEEELEAGPGEAITLEEFGDYQCTPCGQLHPTLKELKRQYGADVNFVFHNLPLISVHKNAMIAARAAEAARMQGRFWEMHDRLFETQESWTSDADPKPRFLKMAGELGLDADRLGRDMDNEQVDFRIEADRDTALRLGIEETPVIIINGHQLKPELTTPEGIKKGLEMMFAK
jgi:protein-disulfide isomerase